MSNHIPIIDMSYVRTLAYAAHRDQKRRDGTQYIDHVRRVVEACSKYRCDMATAVAWLHDVLEDSDVTVAEIQRRLMAAGFDDIKTTGIVHAVQLMTHAKGVAYMDYVKNIAQSPLAVRAKMCDLADNLTDVPGKKRAVYMEALNFLTLIHGAEIK